MIIMFMITSTTSVASVATITLAAFEIVDERAQLRSEKLTKQEKSNLSSKLQKTLGWVSLDSLSDTAEKKMLLYLCSSGLKGLMTLLDSLVAWSW